MDFETESITLRWSHIGGASSYEVCCESQNSGEDLNRCNEATDVDDDGDFKTTTIRGLQSNTLYTFTVRAVCMSEDTTNTDNSQTSNFSDSIEAATSKHS